MPIFKSRQIEKVWKDLSMRIATFGSCLSRYTGMAYAALFGGELVGSVYHNRSDFFVSTHIDKVTPHITKEVIANLRLSGAAGARARVLIENQSYDGTLGKHGGYQPGFMEAVKGPLDLIIMDNYVDVVGRLLLPKANGAPPIFALADDIPNWQQNFTLGEYIEITSALRSWKKLIDWTREQQRGTQIVYINFPFDHHPNPKIVQRAREFSARFKTTRIRVIPQLTVAPQLIRDNSHFHDHQYAMYAGYIANIFRGRKGLDDGADNALSAGILT